MSEKTNEAKQAAREIVRIAVEDAKRDAERIRAEKLELVDAQKDTLLSGKSSDDDRKDVIDGLVDEICKVITTTEKGGDSNF
jgi:hypothetical protein